MCPSTSFYGEIIFKSSETFSAGSVNSCFYSVTQPGMVSLSTIPLSIQA